MDTRLKSIVLYAATGLALARLAGFGFELAGEAIQTDFAAYYTAGQMVAAGLSPYRYLITPERIIWTSGDFYQHAQYIYPPLMAMLFAPVSRALTYLDAKYAWWFVDLLCAALSLSFSRRAMRLPLRPWGWLHLTLAGLFHPLFVQLLRGQVDLVTGALIGAAFWLLARKRSDLWAGGVLGATAILKFHAGFILPFLVIRRKWRAVTGFCAAAAVMVALNVVVAGPVNVQRYLAELPRISVYGGDGPPESAMTPEQFALVLPLHPLDSSLRIKDGFTFAHEGFEFVTSASFVEVICCGTGFHISRTAASLAVWGYFIAAFALLAWRGYADPVNRRDEYIYWFAAANVALLAGPTTWAMNVVWLLPAFPILVYLWQTSDGSPAAAAAALCFAVGLLLVAMPDHNAFPGLFPRVLLRLSIYKYPLGEGLFILGAFVHFRHSQLALAGRVSPQAVAKPAPGRAV